ncbi:methionine ABC transporter ATP-binding protein [Limnochorda pilosa]|uniref:Methionine ABC transporter ATP-binding protein n=1 Tax=Limnochorda pilosa TaxID=1555112 RepID=A0A0K2SQY2_LIMPI|nr:ATP-binding cassette domain-containing protein [Limnochorda pilosa]BAS29214.1 methionine ABC transporter ATP-binding protein [Limnochorda pilosa]
MTVRLQGVHKGFVTEAGRIEALRGLDLEVHAGEIYGVIGVSGAGKSTLVRCINRLERPDAGRIEVDGVDLATLEGAELRRVRQRIGMVFQHFNLLRSRTVAGNVALPLEVTGRPRREIQERVAELLEWVGLAGRADSYPSQLSGGQKQRVGIARALANRPDLLLCDEPTSALDPETTASVLDLLRRVRDEMGLTILIITHEMAVVRAICDRVAVVESGRVVEEGPAARMLVEPASAAARRLLGFAEGSVHLPERPAPVPGEQARLLELRFVGEVARQPVITHLVRRFPVTANILGGQIDRLAGAPFGVLLVELTGGESELEGAIAYLREAGVAVGELQKEVGGR